MHSWLQPERAFLHGLVIWAIRHAKRIAVSDRLLAVEVLVKCETNTVLQTPDHMQ